MSMNVPEDFNVYAPPQASIAPAVSIAADDDVAWTIRRRHLLREIAVKSCGYFALAYSIVFGLLLAADLIIIAYSFATGERRITRKMIQGSPWFGYEIIMVAAGYAGLALASASVFQLGRGLCRLRPWPRWVCGLGAMIGAAGLAIRSFVVPGVPRDDVIGYGFCSVLLVFLSLLFIGPGGAYLFSDEYRAVVKSTPGARLWKTRRTARK